MADTRFDADVCLLLEGTYPYVAGGVSTWIHDLIRAQSHLTFHIVCILPLPAERPMKYELPPNVVGVSDIYLHAMPAGRPWVAGSAALLKRIGPALAGIHRGGGLDDLRTLVEAIGPQRDRLGRRVLLNSRAAWQTLLDMYEATMPAASFLDYFWSWRGLVGGLLACLLAPLPRAACYHAVSTGYAGILATRAKLETERPVLLTEHGIYTNERRIEINMADWLFSGASQGLAVDGPRNDLRDVWINTFVSYSRATYAACDRILTLYGGNQLLQLEDGADPARMRIVPNGIDVERYAALQRRPHARPTVALIGRVVPIKDVKTYLRACGILRRAVPDLRALVMGPTDEDEDYYEECLQIVDMLDLRDTVEFTGRVRIDDWFPEIDVIVLTSISEAQPLVILEAGAAGIPTVATDVGACREMIEGQPGEDPPLGHGGAVTALSNPRATAEALVHLLSDTGWRAACGEAIRARTRAIYNKAVIDAIYRDLYAEAVASPPTPIDTLPVTRPEKETV